VPDDGPKYTIRDDYDPDNEMPIDTDSLEGLLEGRNRNQCLRIAQLAGVKSNSSTLGQEPKQPLARPRAAVRQPFAVTPNRLTQADFMNIRLKITMMQPKLSTGISVVTRPVSSKSLIDSLLTKISNVVVFFCFGVPQPLSRNG
jgi:hypothetical protein